MSTSNVKTETYQYFQEEAPEILLEIEQELFTLSASWDSQVAHRVMRLTHTLKGAAASTGLDTLTTISHLLEDIFRALARPGVTMTPEVSAFLFEGYECLQTALMAELTDQAVDTNRLIQQTQAIFDQVRDRFTEQFESEDLPTPEQLGFDIVQSIFEGGVTERLDHLETVISAGDVDLVTQQLKEYGEIFIELSESLGLKGFGQIAQVALTALDHYPSAGLTIARLALVDFREGRRAVANGDRSQGGRPSDVLCKMVAAATGTSVVLDSPPAPAPTPVSPPPPSTSAPSSPDPASLSPVRPTPSTPGSSSTLTVPASTSPPTPTNQPNIAASATPSAPSAPQPATLTASSSALAPATLTSPPATKEPMPQEVAVHHLRLSPVESAASHAPSASGRSSVVRINVDHVNYLNSSLAEVLTVQNRQKLQDDNVQQSVHQLIQKMRQHQQQLNQLRDWSEQQLVQSQKKQLSRSSLSPQLETFDALELDQYSEFQGIIQDVLEDAASLHEAVDAVELLTRESSQSLRQQQRLLTNTQDALMNARMVPLNQLFNRLHPIVERLQARYQKQVNLTCTGSELRVDKAIAEQLYETLLHLVRNAFDHGIEALSLRQQRQKPATGQIQISAQQQGNILLIKIQDDGDGLNLDTIRGHAIQRGHATVESAQQLSDNELIDLLFEPGFSTTTQVSDLSGRGVGLDVVATQLRAINGTIAITSHPAQGVEFTLRIPLQLVITRLLLCTVDGRTYGLLLNGIEQIITPQPQQIAPPQMTQKGKKVLRLGKDSDERLISVYPLASLLPYDNVNLFPVHTPPSESPHKPIILLNPGSEEEGNQILGIEVDQVIGEQELVLRPLHPIITPPSYVCGGSIMGDSQLALVLNGISLAQHAQSQAPTPQVQPPSSVPPSITAPSLPALSTPEPSTPAPATQEPSQTLRSPVFPKAKQPKVSPNRSVLPPATSSPAPQSAPGQEHQAPIAKSTASAAMACTQILVVDDSITIRRDLASTLVKHGYSVVQAKDGLDALDSLKQHSNIRLVLCDIEMPRMNGFEFIKHHKANNAISSVPVVVLTSRTGAKHRILATEMGAVAYLNKPWIDTTLLNLVESLLNPTD